MARHFFRSSRSPRTRTAPPVLRLWGRTAVVGAVVAFSVVALRHVRARPEESMARHFARHRADFERLRDLISAEPALTSVGLDHVGDYALFDGRWLAPGNRFRAVSRAEMLAAVGLSSERYQTYRDALARAQAHRVFRRSTEGGARWSRIALFPMGGNPDGATRSSLVYSEQPPGPLLTLDRARRSPATSYARLDDGWYIEYSRR